MLLATFFTSSIKLLANSHHKLNFQHQSITLKTVTNKSLFKICLTLIINEIKSKKSFITLDGSRGSKQSYRDRERG